MPAHVNNFRELIVYTKTRVLSKEVFELSKRLPRDENFSLKEQIRRSARSIGANIAEAWGKRRYEKHFVSKLTDANAEQMETQHWIDTACTECGYFDKDNSERLLKACDEIGRMLSGMMQKADLFCGHRPFTVREEQAAYGSGDDDF